MGHEMALASAGTTKLGTVPVKLPEVLWSNRASTFALWSVFALPPLHLIKEEVLQVFRGHGDANCVGEAC